MRVFQTHYCIIRSSRSVQSGWNLCKTDLYFKKQNKTKQNKNKNKTTTNKQRNKQTRVFQVKQVFNQMIFFGRRKQKKMIIFRSQDLYARSSEIAPSVIQSFSNGFTAPNWVLSSPSLLFSALMFSANCNI